jgi:hypothetical protein
MIFIERFAFQSCCQSGGYKQDRVFKLASFKDQVNHHFWFLKPKPTGAIAKTGQIRCASLRFLGLNLAAGR